MALTVIAEIYETYNGTLVRATFNFQRRWSSPAWPGILSGSPNPIQHRSENPLVKLFTRHWTPFRHPSAGQPGRSAPLRSGGL